MKFIKYGYYVEDEAQKVFLENLLQQIPHFFGLEEEYVFERDDVFSQNFLVAGDRNNFEGNFIGVCFNGIDEYKQDVFFLGRDLDHKSHEKFESKLTQMREALAEICKSKTIIFLPIQCTEYWLRYLKEIKKTENQDLSQKFENQKKKTIKKNIYGNKKGTAKKQILEELCQNIDIQSLCVYSQSFEHFVKSIATFLKV